MNVLLTGATGFIGQRLVKRLLERGHFVSVFTRRVQERTDRNVGQFYWDMKGPAPAEPFDNCDAVIHLAGEPVAQRWSDEVKQRIRESRVAGTRHLVDGIAAVGKKPQALISASATGYYGDRGSAVLTESAAPGTGFLPEVCIAWEREAERAATLGLRVVTIRTGIALGADGGALKQMLPPFKLGAGGKLGSGEQWMSWIHVDDLVNLYVYAVEDQKVRGPVNGVSPAPVKNEEFTQALARTIDRPAMFAVPAFALKLLFGEMSAVLLESQRILPEATQAAGFQFQHPGLARALDNLLR